jgi:hypothetical protein
MESYPSQAYAENGNNMVKIKIIFFIDILLTIQTIYPKAMHPTAQEIILDYYHHITDE